MSEPCRWDEVCARESAAIVASRADDAKSGPLSGLAFSGGGIRSATFNLGVLQALASKRLLQRFDYLSTVSGGGYIGTWLTALIHYIGDALGGAPNRRVTDEFQRALALSADGGGQGKAAPGHEDPVSMKVREAVEHLRTFSNYLTPRPGWFGLDTLTGIAIYLRNVALNFALILAPTLALFLGIHLTATAPRLISDPFLPGATAAGLLIAAAVMMGTLLAPAPVTGTRNATAAGDPRTLFAALLALLFSVAVALWLWTAAPSVERPDILECAGYGIAASAILWLLTGITRQFWVITRALRNAMRVRRGQPVEPGWSQDDRSVPSHAIGGLVVGSVSGALGGVLLAALYDAAKILRAPPSSAAGEWGLLERFAYFARNAQDGPAEWLLITVAPPIIMLVLSAMFALHIALARRALSIHDTEVLGRLGGAILLFSLAWLVAFALACFVPAILASIDWLAFSSAVVWLASTLIGVLLGKSSATGDRKRHPLFERMVVVFPYVFIVGFFVFGALLATWVVAAFAPSNPVFPSPPASWLGWASYYAQAFDAALRDVLVAVGMLALATLVLSVFVDINLFSYHNFYRNRLARCYLGAARWAAYLWRPSRITGLDPDDDLRIKDLAAGQGAQRPYLIVNAALNLTRPANTAWLQRQAAPFVFTPLYCGYSMPGTGGHGEKSFYRPTHEYMADRGPQLSLAMALSGAAASPNMGYHSSPAMAFLLTLFNVRLGSWCGNPNSDPAWKSASPQLALRYLLSELLGRTDENKPFVYLSDGGHFENLGVYELVRRRCKLIVACDAGADSAYALEDLANAIEKCELDFGVRFEGLDLRTFAPREDPVAGPIEARRQCTGHFTTGCVLYPIDGNGYEQGVFIYIKASICGNEPPDILHYAATHLDFPHESTSDQWFDEQQFESYRKLGFQAATAAADSIRAALSDARTMPETACAVRSRLSRLVLGALRLLWRN